MSDGVVFRALMLDLFDAGWNRRLTPRHQTVVDIDTEIRENLTQMRPIGSREDLERRLRPDLVNLMRDRQFIYLPEHAAGDKSILPIVSMSFIFSADEQKLSMLVMPFILDTDTAEIQVIPMRFETPEGVGTHDYHHVQLTTAIERTVLTPIYGCPTWLPVKQPALPLNATDPVQLALCALIGLYGKAGITMLRRTSGVDPYLRAMKMIA